MRPVMIGAGFLFTVAGLSAAIWSARYAPWARPQPRVENPIVFRLREMREGADRQAGHKPETTCDAAGRTDPAVEPRPPVAEDPPFPKAVVAERVFDFGRMGTDEQRKHRFRIENRGEAPLVIAKGPTECKCTLSNLASHQVAPGASTEIEVEWTPRAPDRLFDKTAIIWTNDPASPEIHLEVAGKVVPTLEVAPRTWNAGAVTDDQDGTARGTVVSETAGDFQIVAIEPPDPNIKVSFQAMAPRELARRHLRAGYEFLVTVGKNIRLGHFRSRLRIATSLPDKQSVDVEVTGQRSGPIRFLPAVALVGAARWNADKLLLNMGRFDHVTGAKTALPALVYSMKDNFRVLGVKSSDNFVKVSLEPIVGDQKRAKEFDQQQVRFIFEVPPGSPPVNCLTGKPVHVTVTTNHPRLRDLDFDLSFVSR
jgi:hypothetical protein